jgi:ribokinase
MEPEILVVGALHFDVIVTAPHLPGRDETLMGSAVAYAFGGKGGNQAAAAARMGARTAMAGRLGRDRFAATVLAALDAAGVDHTGVSASDGATGMSIAMVDAAGDYFAVVVSGVNRDIRAEDVAIAPDLSVLILQNEIPEAVNAALIARLDPAMTLILNAAPARRVSAAVLGRTDILIVNRVEAAMLTGQSPEVLDPAAAVRALAALGPKSVIVTLGADGVVASGFQAPACKVDVISTHGAGDAFTGALAARIAAGDDLQPACRFAQAAAALHVSTPPDHRAAITPAQVWTML